MKRLMNLVGLASGALAIVAFAAGTALSQGGATQGTGSAVTQGTGSAVTQGPGSAVTQGPGSAVTQGQGTAAGTAPAQTGVSGQMGSGRPGTGAYMGSGQPGTAAHSRGAQPGASLPSAANSLPTSVELYGRNPWFANPSVQQQLRLNPNQLNQLNRSYQGAYQQYQQRINPNYNSNQAANADRNDAAGRGQANAGASATTSNNAATGNAGTAAGGRTGADSNSTASGSTTAGQAGGVRQLGSGQTGAVTQAGSNQTAAGGGTTANSNVRVGFNADGSRMSPGDRGTLSADQAEAARLAAQRQFDSTFSQNLDSILLDPAQRARFNQLYTQYRGYDAFLDPTIRQRLNLTDPQQQQLLQLRQTWLNQMREFRDNRPTDRAEAARQWNILRAQFAAQVNQVLTPLQQQRWAELYGTPFDFDSSFYFGSDDVPGTTQDFQLENRQTATGGTQFPGAGTALGRDGTTIGTSANPTPGSGVGTAGNTGTGSGVGTAGNTGTGSSVGTGGGGTTNRR